MGGWGWLCRFLIENILQHYSFPRITTQNMPSVWQIRITWWQKIHLSEWPLEAPQSRHCCFSPPDINHGCCIILLFHNWHNFHITFALSWHKILHICHFSQNWDCLFVQGWRDHSPYSRPETNKTNVNSWVTTSNYKRQRQRQRQRQKDKDKDKDLCEFGGYLSDNRLAASQSTPSECVTGPQHPTREWTLTSI